MRSGAKLCNAYLQTIAIYMKFLSVMQISCFFSCALLNPLDIILHEIGAF